MHSSWQDIAWECYTSFFAHLHQSYGPWVTPKFRFHSISWELTDIFSPNFIYAFLLTRLASKLIEFHQSLYLHLSWQELAWDCYASFFAYLCRSYVPLFTQKNCFRSITWELTDIFSPNFINALILTRSSLELLHVIFSNFNQSYGPLYWMAHFQKISRILSFGWLINITF